MLNSNNGNIFEWEVSQECFSLCEKNKACWLVPIRYLLKVLDIAIDFKK